MSTHIANASALTLTASDTSTMLEVGAPASARLMVHEWGASFSGTTASDTPILVELVRTDGGTGGTTLTLADMEVDPTGETFAGTAAHTITTEATNVDVLDSVYVHPNGGSARLQTVTPVLVVASAYIGIRFTTGTVTTGTGQAVIAFTA